MTREHAGDSSRWDATRGIRTPRFRLKPTRHASGYEDELDGAWWPYSDDLISELPGLIAVLSARLAAVSSVTYNRTDWRMAPAELVSAGRVVQLDGSRAQPPNTLEVLGSKGNKTVLLVIPFHLDADQAYGIAMAAAAPRDVSSVDTLLMISVQGRESRTKRDAARERWDEQRSKSRINSSN